MADYKLKSLLLKVIKFTNSIIRSFILWFCFLYARFCCIGGYELASDSESKMATNRNCFSAGGGYFDDVTSPVGRPAPPRNLDFPYRTENSCYLSARRGDCSCCIGGCHHRNQSLTRDDPMWPIHPSAPLSSLQQLQQGCQQQRQQQQHKHMSYTFPASVSTGFMSPSQAINGLDVGKFVDRFSNAQQIYPTFPVLCHHCQGCGPATTHESFFSIASSPPPTYTDSSSLQSGENTENREGENPPSCPEIWYRTQISNLKHRNYNWFIRTRETMFSKSLCCSDQCSGLYKSSSCSDQCCDCINRCVAVVNKNIRWNSCYETCGICKTFQSSEREIVGTLWGHRMDGCG